MREKMVLKWCVLMGSFVGCIQSLQRTSQTIQNSAWLHAAKKTDALTVLFIQISEGSL